jgi:hypothetical protein
VVKRVALPSVLEPQVMLLQCTLPKPTPAGIYTTQRMPDDSPVYFYLKLGGIIAPDTADNGWSTVLQDPVLTTTMATWPILWVNAAEHDMLLVKLLARHLPVPGTTPKVMKAGPSPKDSRYAWFPVKA